MRERKQKWGETGDWDTKQRLFCPTDGFYWTIWISDERLFFRSAAATASSGPVMLNILESAFNVFLNALIPHRCRRPSPNINQWNENENVLLQNPTGAFASSLPVCFNSLTARIHIYIYVFVLFPPQEDKASKKFRLWYKLLFTEGRLTHAVASFPRKRSGVPQAQN